MCLVGGACCLASLIWDKMSAILINAISFCMYYLGVDSLFYWLNRKAKRIITFHNVLPDGMFRVSIANGVSNRLNDFEKIVYECGKRFKFSTDLLDANTMTITFDDGYRNQYTTAFKALQKRGIPAYLFVSGDAENVLTIDKLLHWVAEAPMEYIPGGDRLQYWIKDVWPRFMADSERKGLTVFESLNTVYSYDMIIANLPKDYMQERLSGISPNELDEMRNAGWKIGWHSKSHYPLAKLNEDELMRELDSPKEFKDVCLSYPYGNPEEVGSEAIKVAEALGYPCAVSNTNAAFENKSPFFMPRMSLPADKFRLHFRLSGLEHFLKTRHLLSR